jgi:mannose-1-phosphate guanylyltransferase/phosphomannomutase
LQFGVAVTDDDCRITRFIEKPGWSMAVSDRVNTGMYLLEPEVWEGFGPGEKFDFSMDGFPKLMERGGQIFGMTTESYWCDIGGSEQYIAAHRDIFDGKCRIELSDAKLINGIFAEDGARIAEGMRGSRAVLSRREQRGRKRRLRRGVYGFWRSGTSIGEGASVRRSVLWMGCGRPRARGASRAVVCDPARARPGRSSSNKRGRRESPFLDGATVKSGVKIWPQKSVEEAPHDPWLSGATRPARF